MLQTPDFTNYQRARPAQARRAAHHLAKQHDSTHAPLGAGCALDLPTLHHDIPTSITLAGNSEENRLRDSLLHLALQGADSKHFKMARSHSPVQHLLRAAEAALETALEPVTRPLGLDSALWTSLVEAEKADTSCEAIGHDASPLPEARDYAGDDLMIIEITPGKTFEVAPAGLAQSTVLGKRTQAIESVCPGFIALVYTVLELVNRHLYPVFTPRHLFEEYINNGFHDGATSVTDIGIATAELMENCGDWDELLAQHGFTSETVAFKDIIEIYQEQIGGVLPSDFITQFGTAALCHCYWSEQEEMPANPEPSLWSDLNTALAMMEIRPAHEVATREAIHALQMMIDIGREINSGARFLSGANYLCVPSYSAAQVWSDKSESFFSRVLDDCTRGAMESGEVTNALGWIVARADTPQTTAQSLQDIHRGATATAMALTFLNFIGEVA